MHVTAILDKSLICEYVNSDTVAFQRKYGGAETQDYGGVEIAGV